MSEIALLNQDTIDKIAAGEVVERPSSVVKELVENAIDAGADAVTVEIREGGISLIRVTDNGCGIQKEDVRLAFLRHATSKIRSLEDLHKTETLGFRGEALSSISAVAQVEMITKPPEELLGIRYQIEGGKEISFEEIGSPDGTTILVRNLFYNTPARRKFLKSPVTEASYISDLMERLALSHPDCSFKLIVNNETKLYTSGNGRVKDIIYNVYGREISTNLAQVDREEKAVRISGFIGKPVISRGNRNYEIYFVNGRSVRNSVLSRAIEEAYKPFMMTRRFPFTVLMLNVDSELVDVNVHPAKMEVRFADQNLIYDLAYQAVRDALTNRDLIPEVGLDHPYEKEKKQEKQEKQERTRFPEPFETKRSEMVKETAAPWGEQINSEKLSEEQENDIILPDKVDKGGSSSHLKPVTGVIGEQQELFRKEGPKAHKLVGQIFNTYWIVEFEDKMYIIDQHAAHEKVLYERFMKKLKNQKQTSQMVTPPILVSLSMQEEEMLTKHLDCFTEIGFEIEPFGGKEYAISAVPGDFPDIADETLFRQLLDGLTDIPERAGEEAVCEKIASMSCKAAVKGNQKLSTAEADALIEELLSLDNPYNCPHGRPTIITMSKYELEKKFKRIV